MKYHYDEDLDAARRDEYVYKCIDALVDGAWSLDDDALVSCLVARRLSIASIKSDFDYIKSRVADARPDLGGSA